MIFARTLPSVTTLESDDENQLATELRLVRLRTQVAVVRTLADQIELLMSPRHVDGLSDQLMEEVATLRGRLFEAASELRKSPAQKDTEVFHRRPALRAMKASSH
jgi:hypothetical protein